MTGSTSPRLLAAAKSLAQEFAGAASINASVRLWDGSIIPLGPAGGPTIVISSPGVISSLLRRPTLDRLIRHYAHGQIGLEGGTLIDLGEQLGRRETRNRLRKIGKWKVFKSLWPFLLAPAEAPGRTRDYAGDETGEKRKQIQNKDFIKFHYDVGNDFYALFLDQNMQYSCGYFTEWSNSLEQAQIDKMDMICRKLRLKPGERFLDIGCGWGGLVCYAAEHYGVQAHGITLSPSQLERAETRIAARGLTGKVTVEIRDYADMTGTFDKIASVGMAEHIGVANLPAYLAKVRGLLSKRGLFLNHAISRRAKHRNVRFSKRPEQRALLKYIFPGGELDDIGHTVRAMEQQGFEVHDVEAWRPHYALTTRAWCERLTSRREEAVALAGSETYRIWVAYLAACSLAFSRGTARIYQTLLSKTSKGDPLVPPTRADLYR